MRRPATKPIATILASFLLALTSNAQAPAPDTAGRLDKNGDGRISRTEVQGTAAEQRFDALDRNKDGYITADEFPRARRTAPASAERPGSSESVRTLNVPYAPAPPGVDVNLLSLDIYAPKDAANLPVMIYIHGGGWHRGDKAAVSLKPGYFTTRNFIFVSLNYRLVPAVDILTQLQDSANAIAWVHSNIARHGGDPARLHLIGHSAGAHHVAILATNERFLKNAGAEVSIFSSVVELDTMALDVPKLMRNSRTEAYAQAFGADPEVWRQISPLQHVTPGKGIPPFLLVVAGGVRPKLEQAAAFQKALEAAGVRCEVIEAPQHDHGSVNRSIGAPGDEVTAALEKFINNGDGPTFSESR